MAKEREKDLFGNDIYKGLEERFGEPPFTTLDTRQGRWQNRKRKWMALGIQSEVGRKKNLTYNIPLKRYNPQNMEEEYYNRGSKTGTSVFDPALCELVLKWFCPEGGRVLDPFAGGSVRGVISNYLGYHYTGIELSEEQIEANRAQAEKIMPDKKPTWIQGDSDKVLDKMMESKFETTPIEQHDDIWIKREDLFNIHGANGAKSRTAYTLLEKAIEQGYKKVTTAGSRMSPQINIIATLASEMGLEFTAHTPEGELSEELQHAKEVGAKIIQYRAGYNSVILSRCRTFAEQEKAYEIPFGMTCDDAPGHTAAQVKNIPEGVKRIVIPVGSGMNLAGLLWGLKKAELDIPVVGVRVGADPEKTLDAFAPPYWQQMVTLVDSGMDYHKKEENNMKWGITFDPIYEAKCIQFIQPGDLFWVVGIRRTLLPAETPKNSYGCAPKYDFILSCPPYADLEVYSDHPDDLSNMPYEKFLEKYESIISKSLMMLKPGAYICWVVGEVRDKDGFYREFVPDTKRAFRKAGARLYNEAILINPVGSACMRASKQFEASKKLAKLHQNVLIFKKI